MIVEPERLTGEAVNIAARIESFAVPGGVMLSDSAYDQIKNRSDVAVVALGRFRLKNVGRPFELYAVSADGLVVPGSAALEGKGERFASLPSNLPEPGHAARRPRPPIWLRSSSSPASIGSSRSPAPAASGRRASLVELGRMLAPEFLDGVAFVAAGRRHRRRRTSSRRSPTRST